MVTGIQRQKALLVTINLLLVSYQVLLLIKNNATIIKSSVIIVEARLHQTDNFSAKNGGDIAVEDDNHHC